MQPFNLNSSVVNSESSGVVYWFTGLSGSGKSTLATLFCSRLRESSRSVIYLDGDLLRNIFGLDEGYSLSDRKQLAMRYSRLCLMLACQGFDVVIATISMFYSVRSWNRANYKFYYEIYLKVPLDVLIARDQKGLYSRALLGEVKNVIGIDVEMEEPLSPDYTIFNDGKKTPSENIEALWLYLLNSSSA